MIWKQEIPGRYDTLLEVVGERVIHRHRADDEGGEWIAALDFDGKLQWRSLVPEMESFRGLDGVVFTDGPSARCLDSGTGRLLAERKFEVGVRIVGPSTGMMVYDDFDVYAALADEGGEPKPIHLWGLHPRDLSIVWERTEEESYRGALRREGIWRFLSTQELSILSIPDSNEIVRCPFPYDPLRSAQTLQERVLFVWTDEVREALDTVTGEVVWRFPNRRSHGYGVPNVREGFAFLFGSGLTCYDLESGKEIWYWPSRHSHRNDVLQDDGGIVAAWAQGTVRGVLQKFAISTGRLLRSVELPFGPWSLASLPDGRVIVGGLEDIWCVQMPSGSAQRKRRHEGRRRR